MGDRGNSISKGCGGRGVGGEGVGGEGVGGEGMGGTLFQRRVWGIGEGATPFQRDGDASCSFQGWKLWILVSLRVFRMECQYF